MKLQSLTSAQGSSPHVCTSLRCASDAARQTGHTGAANADSLAEDAPSVGHAVQRRGDVARPMPLVLSDANRASPPLTRSSSASSMASPVQGRSPLLPLRTIFPSARGSPIGSPSRTTAMPQLFPAEVRGESLISPSTSGNKRSSRMSLSGMNKLTRSPTASSNRVCALQPIETTCERSPSSPSSPSSPNSQLIRADPLRPIPASGSAGSLPADTLQPPPARHSSPMHTLSGGGLVLQPLPPREGERESCDALPRPHTAAQAWPHDARMRGTQALRSGDSASGGVAPARPHSQPVASARHTSLCTASTCASHNAGDPDAHARAPLQAEQSSEDASDQTTASPSELASKPLPELPSQPLPARLSAHSPESLSGTPSETPPELPTGALYESTPEPTPEAAADAAAEDAPEAVAPAAEPRSEEAQRLERARLERLRHVDLPPEQLGKFAEYYSEEGLRKRLELMKHPAIVMALERLWEAANTDAADEMIDFKEYTEMHRKITLALMPEQGPRQALKSADEDWVVDSEGVSGLDRERFFWCWFELADLWVDSIDPEKYAHFLENTMYMIVEYEEDGTTRWRSDADVISEYFEERRKQGKADTAEMNERKVQAMWSELEYHRKEHVKATQKKMRAHPGWRSLSNLFGGVYGLSGPGGEELDADGNPTGKYLGSGGRGFGFGANGGGGSEWGPYDPYSDPKSPEFIASFFARGGGGGEPRARHPLLDEMPNYADVRRRGPIFERLMRAADVYKQRQLLRMRIYEDENMQDAYFSPVISPATRKLLERRKQRRETAMAAAEAQADECERAPDGRADADTAASTSAADDEEPAHSEPVPQQSCSPRSWRKRLASASFDTGRPLSPPLETRGAPAAPLLRPMRVSVRVTALDDARRIEEEMVRQGEEMAKACADRSSRDDDELARDATEIDRNGYKMIRDESEMAHDGAEAVCEAPSAMDSSMSSELADWTPPASVRSRPEQGTSVVSRLAVPLVAAPSPAPAAASATDSGSASAPSLPRLHSVSLAQLPTRMRKWPTTKPHLGAARLAAREAGAAAAGRTPSTNGKLRDSISCRHVPPSRLSQPAVDEMLLGSAFPTNPGCTGCGDLNSAAAAVVRARTAPVAPVSSVGTSPPSPPSLPRSAVAGRGAPLSVLSKNLPRSASAAPRAMGRREWPQHGGTSAEALQKLVVDRQNPKLQLEALAAVVRDGPDGWYAIPLVLQQVTCWTDLFLQTGAKVLHGALTSCGSSLELRERLSMSLLTQPVLGALVALCQRDAQWLNRALRQCSPTDTNRVRHLARIVAPDAVMWLNTQIMGLKVHDLPSQHAP